MTDQDVQPPPERTPPRYPMGRLALIVAGITVVSTAILVVVLSQAPPQAGTGGETIATPAPASGIRGIVAGRIGADRVLQESEAPDPARPGYVAVHLAFHAADNATRAQTVRGIEMDVFTLMEALYTSGKRIGRVTVVAEMPYQNSAGDYPWCQITVVTLTKDRADRIPWSRTDWRHLWPALQIEQQPRFCT